MIQNGHIGQVRGPFEAGVDLLNDDAPIGMFTPEKERPVLYKIGIQADEGTIVSINNTPISIGGTGIYELDDVVTVTEISFPNGAGENALVDFVYTGRVVR
jgi:hypothetical protein